MECMTALQLGRVITETNLFETNGAIIGVVPAFISSPKAFTLAPLV